MTLNNLFITSSGKSSCHYHFLISTQCATLYALPGGDFWHGCLVNLFLLKEPTNVIVATFIAAIIGSCVSQILSILYKTPAVVFILAILAPLVPGYLSYRTTAFFVTGDYSHAIASATLVVMLALVISIGMASGTVILRLYSHLRKQHNS